MLADYLTQTQRYLQNPGTNAVLLYPADALTAFINRARKQISGETECVRNFATLPITQGNRQYSFSSIVLSSPSTGIEGVLNIRQALIQLGTGAGGQGYTWVQNRPFEWFTLYALNNIVPPEALPTQWSQYGQGVTGSIFIDNVPDASYTMALDTICYPIDLVDDSTAEAIPYPWTDCVPIFAAYYALLSAQRIQDAQQKYEMYELFANRARRMSNPDVLPNNFLQPPQDQTMAQRLGVRAAPGRPAQGVA